MTRQACHGVGEQRTCSPFLMTNDPQAAITALQDRITKLEDQSVMWIQAVELLSPKPGDVVLVTLPDAAHANVAQRTQIAKAFQAMCGPGIKIGVMPASFSVKVVRAADVPESVIAGPGFEHLNSVQQRPTELVMP